MTTPCFRLQTLANDHPPVSSIPIRWLNDKQQSTICLEQTGQLGPMGAHTEPAEELLAIAVAAYYADRSVLRGDQPDGWTRQIRIDVPVHDPSRWDKAMLERTLDFLTGDRWHIKLRRGQPHPELHTTPPALQIVDSAALLSGGVDSTAWAAETVRSSKSSALVSCFGDGTTGRLQKSLISDLVGVHTHCRFRLQRLSSADTDTLPSSHEPTTRSRSLLFLALGLLTARSHRVNQLQMAENGYIAVNVPLHAGRVGSLSTRSAHPQFVNSLNRTLAIADFGASIENPYLFMTKGEVAQRLRLYGEHVAWKTVSCAHPAAARWQGQKRHLGCGYCYPCIIRRAGFHHTGADRTEYLKDPFTDITFYSNPRLPADIRAVARSLLDPVEIGDIRATGRVGDSTTAQGLYRMCQRGAQELHSLFNARATTEVKDTLGL